MQSIPPPDSWGAMACGHVNLGLAAEGFGRAQANGFLNYSLPVPIHRAHVGGLSPCCLGTLPSLLSLISAICPTTEAVVSTVTGAPPDPL